jgi:hypothetical protein
MAIPPLPQYAFMAWCLVRYCEAPHLGINLGTVKQIILDNNENADKDLDPSGN